MPPDTSTTPGEPASNKPIPAPSSMSCARSAIPAMKLLFLAAAMHLAGLSLAGAETPASATAVLPVQDSQWHGFTKHQFSLQGCSAYVVAPAVAAPGSIVVRTTADAKNRSALHVVHLLVN